MRGRKRGQKEGEYLYEGKKERTGRGGEAI